MKRPSDLHCPEPANDCGAGPDPVEKARTVIACLEMLQTEAADIDAADFHALLGAARMAMTDYVNAMTREPAEVVRLRKATR